MAIPALMALQILIPAGAMSMISLGLGLAIVLVACMFMVAYAFQNQQFLAVAKEELAALIFSVILILFWLGSDSIFNLLVTGLLSSSLPSLAPSAISGGAPSAISAGYSSSHITLAIASIDVMVARLIQQYKDLFFFEVVIGFLSTISFPIFSPAIAVNVLSFSFYPYSGLSLLSQAHTVVVETISTIISALWAKQFILYFVRDAIPTLILPLGLVFRAFPFTRSTGSTILAVCFAMYFVFPMSVLFSNYLLYDIYKPADFSYVPVSAGMMNENHDENYWDGFMHSLSGSEAESIRSQFDRPDLASETSHQGTCNIGNIFVQGLCSVRNLLSGAIAAVTSFIGTLFRLWSFILVMSGDLFSAGALLPSRTTAGLFNYVQQEILVISPYLVLVTLNTVIEIIITITMFRSISLAIGGEAEIVGLSKVI